MAEEMSFYQSVTALMGTLGALLAVLLLVYALLKWMGWRRGPMQAGTRHIKLLDRVSIAPDKCLLLVRVAEKTMLVGFSSHSVEKICDIEDPDGVLESAGGQPGGMFASLIAQHIKQAAPEGKGDDK